MYFFVSRRNNIVSTTVITPHASRLLDYIIVVDSFSIFLGSFFGAVGCRAVLPGSNL